MWGLLVGSARFIGKFFTLRMGLDYKYSSNDFKASQYERDREPQGALALLFLTAMLRKASYNDSSRRKCLRI